MPDFSKLIDKNTEITSSRETNENHTPESQRISPDSQRPYEKYEPPYKTFPYSEIDSSEKMSTDYKRPVDSYEPPTKNFSDTDDKSDNSSDGNFEDENQKYDENGTRDLTDNEKQKLKELLNWSDKKIDNNCRIDKDGVIHYKTDCQDMEGKTSDCGVKYERKMITYNGVKIEGVFPKFDSVFDTHLDTNDYQSSNVKQFSECNKKLKEAIKNNPELKSKFTNEQLQDIEEGRVPRGYTWHHSEEPGKMQLVKTEQHDKRIGGAAHTGGSSIWGNHSIDNHDNDKQNKGESF